ncbi:M14 family zinc carboxypeptidase [Nocardioides ungokensis]|uniref:M14 family zinc carboxypeptidase n=1 Tax=Nocardioides ungokensis TaxID=1643322 RepID=UPI0015DD67A9|nr:M14 family zinc carboxypeptidase [Nocardioides ungokensis]
MLRRLGIATAGLALLAASSPGLPSSAQAAPAQRSAVIGTRVLGKSVEGRKIVAWHLGEPGKPKVVLMSAMHGDERAPRQILQACATARRSTGSTCGWCRPTTPTGLPPAPARTRTVST